MSFSFVSVEGCDGAGKTSIRKFLFRSLRTGDDAPLTVTRYSYLDVEHARVLTEAKWHRRNVDNVELLAAMVGDKQALSSRLIVPHLRHRHVIADRFVLSDFADNLVLRSIPFERTYAAMAEAGVRMPDLTLFVATPPKLAAERKAARVADNHNWWDRIELQERLFEAFERLCSAAPPVPVGPVIRVDNSGGQEETFSVIDKEILPSLRLETLPGRPDQRGDNGIAD